MVDRTAKQLEAFDFCNIALWKIFLESLFYLAVPENQIKKVLRVP